MLFNEVVASLQDFELFPVHQIFIFQMNFVLVILCQSLVIFVHADGLVMFEKEVQVLFLEFVRNLEIATLGNVILVHPDLGSAGNVAFDNGADFSRGLVCERAYFVLLHFDDAQEVVPLNGDVIGSAVFNNDLIVLIAVNGDQ